ncbi:RAMP superfamily CRISPR-associated protein [Alkalinema pantanalense CENA528]|uniref:RAMP superfamily CRISPR-associated protein n=1 Tax=Alkalinema pantanalense TaxID=1620705 RepID=UPI003D6DAC4A
MYRKAYGVIEALAPVHVGATAGEETGNLNLIFRDQFTQTGVIPGSSIRGRFRADMRDSRVQWLEEQLEADNPDFRSEYENEKDQLPAYLHWLEREVKRSKQEPLEYPGSVNEQHWYGSEAVAGRPDGGTSEALVKFEYASLVWFPVFCPGQPVVWVTCPMLLKRFKRIAGITADVPDPYTAQKGLQGRQMKDRGRILFFNLGFLEIKNEADLSAWIPTGTDLDADKLVVVSDNDISMLHDMALYRQSRVKLLDDMKKVDTDKGAFFNTEALPEGCILVFPIALKQTGWQPFGNESASELYFGGLESIGFGRCRVSLAGDYQ